MGTHIWECNFCIVMQIWRNLSKNIPPSKRSWYLRIHYGQLESTCLPNNQFFILKISFQKIEHSRILQKFKKIIFLHEKLVWDKNKIWNFQHFLNNINCGKNHKGIRIIPFKQGVCHIVALPFTLKSILRQKKKKFMEIQIFQHAKNIIFKKILQKKPKSFKI